MTPHCLCVRELHHRWHLKRVFVPVFDRRIPVLTIWWFSWIQISHLYRLISCVHVIEASMSEQMNAEQSVNQCLWQIQWRFNRDSMDENISDCCSSLHARSIQDMKLLNCATPSLTCQITCVSAWLEAEDSFFLFLFLQTPLLPPDQEWHQRRTVSNREAQTALILSFSSTSCSWITRCVRRLQCPLSPAVVLASYAVQCKSPPLNSTGSHTCSAVPPPQPPATPSTLPWFR